MLLSENGFDFIEAFIIEGQHTEFAVQKFSNRIFIIVTQFGKISNFYSVRNQVFNDGALLSDRNTKIFDIQQKFGSPSIETEGAIRYLMNFIGETPLEMLICFGMKDPENLNKETLDQIRDVLLTVPIFRK